MSKKLAPTLKSNGKKGTLVSLCREAIVTSLERFPPESFAILDTFEWGNIIRERHKRTRPQVGNGGLDGTGRMTPAVTEPFLSEVEESVPHLSDLKVTDKFVWKDIVEYKFKNGGLSRPNELRFPFPVLEEEIEKSRKILLDYIQDASKNNGDRCIRAINFLKSAPMDVLLLSSSGIGKASSKFLKKADRGGAIDKPLSGGTSGKTSRDILKTTLDSWMTLAANSGVKLKGSPIGSEGKQHPTKRNVNNLDAARGCQSWKALYYHLKEYHSQEKGRLALRMSEKRKKLDQIRPKIVKVHHASSRQRSISKGKRGFMGGGTASVASIAKGASKMVQLRQEAVVTSARRANSSTSATPTGGRAAARNNAIVRPSSSFSNAVAFANCKPSKKRKGPGPAPRVHVELAGNKRMKVPATKKAVANIRRLALLKKLPKR